jgi:tetratricopeptide (TPR) repeat protein
LLTALLCGAGILAGDRAYADASNRTEQARIHFEAGMAAFKNGAYEDALAEFQRGYDLSPRPGFLIDIAQALDRLGRYDEAIAYCERYMSTEPGAGRERKQVEQLMVKLRDLRLRTKERAPPVPAARTESAAGSSEVPEAEAPPPAPEVAPSTPSESPRSASRRRSLGWAGVAVATVGAAGLASGGVLAATAQGLDAQLHSVPPGTVYNGNLLHKRDSEQRAALGLIIGGASALVVGTVTALMGLRRSPSVKRAWNVMPNIDHGFVGASTQLRF